MEELLSIVQTQTSQPPYSIPSLPTPHHPLPLSTPYQTNPQSQSTTTTTSQDLSKLFEAQLAALQSWPSTSDLNRMRSDSFTASDYEGSYTGSSAVSSVYEGYESGLAPAGIVALGGVGGVEGGVGTDIGMGGRGEMTEGMRFSERMGDRSEDGIQDIARWRNDLPELEMGDLIIDGTIPPPPNFPPSSTNGYDGSPESFSYIPSINYPPLPSPSSTYYHYSSTDYVPSLYSAPSIHSVHGSAGQLYRSSSTASSSNASGQHEASSSGKHDGSVDGDFVRYADQGGGQELVGKGQEGVGMLNELDIGTYDPLNSYPMEFDSTAPQPNPSNPSLFLPTDPRLLHDPQTTFDEPTELRRSPSANNPSLALDRYKTERPTPLSLTLPSIPSKSTSKVPNDPRGNSEKSKSKLSFSNFSSTFSRSNSAESTSGNEGKSIRRELSMERTKTERPSNSIVPVGDSAHSRSGGDAGNGAGKGFVGLFKKVKDKF